LRYERRRVALLYLAAIQKDFEQLLRIARVVALLPPEISGIHETGRLRLALLFRVQLQIVKVRFLLGAMAIPQLNRSRRDGHLRWPYRWKLPSSGLPNGRRSPPSWPSNLTTSR